MISTELHDQLGHSLILMKFRFGLVARELTPEQSKARAECVDSADTSIRPWRKCAGWRATCGLRCSKS